MRPNETLLDMARRHVAEGEAHVDEQRRILAELTRDGHPTGQAQALLHQFEVSLAQHRESVARIEAEQRAGRRDARASSWTGPEGTRGQSSPPAAR